MTSLLDPASDVRPIADGVVELEAVLDRMHAAVGAPGAGGSDSIAALERVARRVEALKLRLVARDETAAAASGAGFTDTGSWLARQTRSTRSDAARQTRLATDLHRAPATGVALAAGALSSDHARVILHALAQLPARVSAEQRASVEADLVAKAARFDPSQLRRTARRALESIEPDRTVVDADEDTQTEAEEGEALDKTRFTFYDNDDGTVSGHFTVPTLAFAMLRKVIDALTAPRREGKKRVVPVDWATRRGHALAEIFEHLPTDHLHPKTAATVVVQLREDVLRGALAAVGLDTGHRISAGEARRLACNAGQVPAVLGGRSLPLDLGTSRRLFNETQRVALSVVHTTCAADGCERPFAWCELHHRQPWSRGGSTDLRDAVPLCGWHHRYIHLHGRLP